MARPYAYRSFCRNLPPTGNNKLASASHTKKSGIPIPTPIMSHILTPAPTLLLAFIKLVVKYTNANLQKAIQLVIELFVKVKSRLEAKKPFQQRKYKNGLSRLGSKYSIMLISI